LSHVISRIIYYCRWIYRRRVGRFPPAQRVSIAAELLLLLLLPGFIVCCTAPLTAADHTHIPLLVDPQRVCSADDKHTASSDLYTHPQTSPLPDD